MIKYLWYVIKHKWFVLIECFKVGLYWRGLVHDLDKFRPSEFFPYARFFYTKGKKPVRDETGYYKPTNTGDKKFDMAWLFHIKRNKHHWQSWVLANDYEGVVVFPFPDKDWKEMICDWLGASRAQKAGSIVNWYDKNKDKMQLHPETRKKIENELNKLR